MNIIIPLGGKGERFKLNNYTQPKPLINIFDKQMIFYVLDNLVINSDDKIFIIYYNLEQYNFEHIITKKYPNINFIRLHKQTSGAAETIYLGLQEILNSTNSQVNLASKCMLLDCDTFYTQDIINIYRQEENNAVFYVKNTDPKPIYSYIKINATNTITQIIEKVKISDNANTGIYCFNNINELFYYSKYVVDNNIKINNECYTSCIIDIMLQENKIFKAIELDHNCVFNLGTPEQLNNYINNTYILLFDLDGTLVLTDDIYYDVWTKILKDYNINLTQELFESYIQGNNDSAVLRYLLPTRHDELINIISNIKDTLFIENIHKIKIINNALSFIEQMKIMGHKVSIVTNCNRRVAEEIIKTTNINKYIDYLVIGNECIKSKPYPEPYLKGIQNYNSTSKKTIIFEDSKTGIQSGKNTFPKCLVGVETMYNKTELHEIGVDFTIKDYADLDLKNILFYNNMSIDNIKRYIINSLKDYNITNIEILDHKLKGGFISDVISVKIFTQDNTYDCVLKLENKNETFLSVMANELNLYEREYYFYNNISQYVPIKTPKFYGIIKDDNFNNIGILMNNLINLDYKLNLNLNEESIDVSLKIIDKLALLHSKFWNKEIDKNFKELKKHNDKLFNPKWNNFITSKFDKFKKKWNNILTEKQIEKATFIVNNYQDVQNKMSEGNLTLCHGDVKSPNIFYRELDNNIYEPYFIDWQYVSIGKGVQDLVFFMIESFEINKINLYKNIFKNYYYAKLIEYGVKNYSIDQYNLDFEYASYYFPFFVAIWFGTLNDDELIDKNFPFFFIQRLFNFYEL